MAAISTITEISKDDFPSTIVSGTDERRRIGITIRATSAAITDTLDLSTYFPDLTGIEGFSFQSVAGADAATSVTWTGTTITFAGHTGNGITVLKAQAYY